MFSNRAKLKIITQIFSSDQDMTKYEITLLFESLEFGYFFHYLVLEGGLTSDYWSDQLR